MSRKVTAFGHYGAILRNEQWSWSGVTHFGRMSSSTRTAPYGPIHVGVDEAYARPNMVMQLIELNEETREFRAHLVERP